MTFGAGMAIGVCWVVVGLRLLRRVGVPHDDIRGKNDMCCLPIPALRRAGVCGDGHGCL